MAPTPMPPANAAGAPSQGAAPRDHLAEYLNKNNFIPVWLHPDVAQGVIRHFGRDGHAIVHPHPSTGYMKGGVTPSGIATQDPRGGPGAPPPGAAAPTSQAGPMLMGIPPSATDKSIFAGGAVGAAGPAQKTPMFVDKGTGKVPGKDMGHDSVPAMLEPGEAVFNKKQLKGIQVRPGKSNLVRKDQKAAMKKAAKTNARG